MALADLMKKGFLTSATATVATPATHGKQNRPTVATVAGVAVAKPANAETASTAESLAQFRFDLVQEDMEAGIPCEEIYRINNMAWEFMQVDGMGFDAAIKLAAQIVVHGQVTACEAAYVDVMALFKRLQTNDWKSA